MSDLSGLLRARADGGRTSVAKILLCLVASACVAACGSTGDPSAGGSPVPSRSSGSPSVTPSRSPVVDCPSATEIIEAMDSKGWTGYLVVGRIVCDRGWATTTLRITTVAADPARAVFRRTDGQWHAVIYGTDGLCEARGMRSVPERIRRALGPYC